MATDIGGPDASTSVGSGADTPTDSDAEVDVMEIVRSLLRDYEYMDIPARRYVLGVVVPSIFLGFGLPVVSIASGLPFPVIFLSFLLGMFVPGVAIIYPSLLQDRKRKEIREHFHLFITHLTILSTTNIDRVEVFRTLANEDEYEAIAEEMGRIVALIDTWNQSLDDACRMRAERVSSPLMRDFLERLAYTVGAGRQMSDFLVEEQDSILGRYVVRYESQLDRLELLKDIYMSIVLSVTFGLVFATVIPFIVGIDPLMPVAAVVFLLLFVQAMFAYAFHTVAPTDDVWLESTEITPAREARMRSSLLISIGLALVLSALVYAALAGYIPGGNFPRPLYLAVPFTPLLFPGMLARREEKQIQDRDTSFPAFIRALGAVESVKQTSTSSVLESLRKKDFGSLTEQIDNLYKRLALRVNSQLAWRFFAAETGSYLIQKFSDMYVVGRRMGGEPEQLGSLIEKNISQVLNLRRKRGQATGTMIGTFYGVTAANTFALFVGLEISRMFKQITVDMNLAQSQLGGLLSAQLYDIPKLQFLLFVALLINAFLSSLMIRVVDRGHSLNSMPHFVAQTWLSVIVAVLTIKVTDMMVGI